MEDKAMIGIHALQSYNTFSNSSLAGPVDGDCSTANSKRLELAGYVASLELI